MPRGRRGTQEWSCGGFLTHLNAVIAVALLVLALAAPRLGDSWLARAESLASRFARRKRLVLLTLSLAAIFGRLALLPWFPVPVPEIHDEFSYLLAADTFVHGRLTNPPHPMSLFFETFHVLQHPTYASMYPPAQGAALALGELMGHPWIGVLLSMAAMTAAVAWMLQGWLPPGWALLGAFFVLLRLDLLNYWISSYWGGAVAATGGALVIGGFRRLIHSHCSCHALAIGIGAALLACSRPFEGFVFCLPVAVVLGYWLISKKSPALSLTGRRVIAPVGSILLVTVLFLGYYNWRITGSAFLFPETVSLRTYENMPLFAWQKSRPPLHYSNPQFTLFHKTQHERYGGSFEKWKLRTRERLRIWRHFPGSALMIPFVALPWMFRDRRIRLLLVQFFCSFLGLLAVVYFQLHYAAPLIAVILALSVQAMRHLRQWKLWGRPVGVGLSRAIVLAAVANVAVWSATLPHPVSEPWNLARARLARQLQATPGLHLVIVHYRESHPAWAEWVYNAADIDASKIVWAREIPGQDLAPLLAYFRGRKVWLLEADASPPRLQPYPALADSAGEGGSAVTSHP